MGNSKSKKVKISQSETEKDVEPRERINSIKTDLYDETNTTQQPKNINNENEATGDMDKIKDTDNASSASTVEVLDDKWIPVPFFVISFTKTYCFIMFYYK